MHSQLLIGKQELMVSLYESMKENLAAHFRIDPETVTPDATLESLGLDSLALVELMCVLRDNLGLRTPDGDGLMSLQGTFADLVEAVEQAQPAVVIPAAAGPVPARVPAR
ncbi:acyl carrier protein [Kitasatospora sp. NPDC059795]|uniref:acyl carrier protein n=1 Tax=Kitasatospora sp. NPDC059795 TaxID=3346949 RepID=UPI0036517CD8